jgi:dUTP pyrophosphatase
MPMKPPVVVKVAGPGIVPAYASAGAAGADLCVSESVLISPGERAAVSTGLQLEIPPGYVGLVWPRSGLAVSYGVDTLAGVIDSDYRGELRVVLINLGEEPLILQPGERVAQILIQRVERAEFVRSDSLTESDRGLGGFGSTGR